MVMMDNVYVCRGTHGVEKVKPDPLNLSVNTVVGSNHLEFCEAVFGSLLYFFGEWGFVRDINNICGYVPCSGDLVF